MYTFFYTEASPFSQWHPAEFIIDDVAFRCAEQYMMYGKAKLFGDAVVAEQILLAGHPREQKSLGRKVAPFDAAVWEREREQIVYAGNHAKFTQSPTLLEALMATRGTTLVEASPRDRIWGIGLSASDPRAQDPAQWRGKNLLGQILTRLRDDLSGSRTGS